MLRWRRTPLSVWYHPAYRLPLPALEPLAGIDPRRADSALQALLEMGAVGPELVRRPLPISYVDLGRVHTARLLESLTEPQPLALVLGLGDLDVHVDEVLLTFRLACGGTLGAAREAIARRGPTLNLLGGFGHAAPDTAARLCPVNDVAVAAAVLRDGGFEGRIVVLDLDAHGSDGTAACLARERDVWMGAVSVEGGPVLGRVDETVLPGGAGDELYLRALDGLLGRMPPGELVFVVAGGDIVASDRSGAFALSLDGARGRDVRVMAALRGRASVWLPGGGAGPDAWRVLAGTGLALSGSRKPIARDLDPTTARFAAIADELTPGALAGEGVATVDDFDATGGEGAGRLLGFYTAAGVELALARYGILPQIERLGYRRLRLVLDRSDVGDRLRVLGSIDGREHLLVEAVLARRWLASDEVLFVHWLTLRNPNVVFDASRPLLPGQQAPGLGLGREADEMLVRMAHRLGLAGVVFRPAELHVAWVARARYRFVDPVRQGRFEALVRDLADRPLGEASALVAAGRVRMVRAGSEREYRWEPDEMAQWIDRRAEDSAAVAAEREAVRFRVA